MVNGCSNVVIFTLIILPNVYHMSSTVTQLTETVPLLYNKLKQLQQRIPVQSIANNITRIQDLIAQARDAANRVCT